MTLGNYILGWNQKVAEFTEQVDKWAAGEVGGWGGMAIMGDWVFLLVLGGNQCFVKVLGEGLPLGEGGQGLILSGGCEWK